MAESYIYMDYRDTLRKAEQLEHLADRLSGIADRSLSEMTLSAVNSWHGESAAAFGKKSEKLQDLTKRHAANLRAAAQGLRRMAMRYQAIEESARSIFRR